MQCNLRECADLHALHRFMLLAKRVDHSSATTRAESVPFDSECSRRIAPELRPVRDTRCRASRGLTDDLQNGPIASAAVAQMLSVIGLISPSHSIAVGATTLATRFVHSSLDRCIGAGECREFNYFDVSVRSDSLVWCE